MTALPAGHTARAAKWDDLPVVLALVQAVDIATLGEADTTSEDLRSEWSLPRFHPEDGALLVHDGNAALVGYGWVWERIPGEAVVVDGYAHPDADPGVDPALLAWGMQRAQALVDAAGVAMEVKTHCAEEEPRIPLLEASGFVLARRFDRMVVDLQAAPEVRPPDGIRIGPLDLARDAEAVHAAIQEAFADHWGSHPEPFEEWHARHVERADFDPGLWAVAHDGEEVAGAVIGRTDAELGAGWIPTVAVRRPWRGRGLGGALLRAAFSASFGAGYTNVQLGVDTANTTGATRLYEREGMRVAFVLLAYTMTLQPQPLRAGRLRASGCA